MSNMSIRSRRALIHLCYLLPGIFGILLVIYAAIPHFWFVYNGEAYTTMNLFALHDNAWELYGQIKAGTIENTPTVTWFAQLLPVVSGLFWALPIIYALITIVSTGCMLVAFSFEPTARISNRAKRVLQIVCPNRVTYLLFPLLPLFSSLFPQMILWLYRFQGMNIRLHTLFLSDWILVLAFAVINAAVFIVSLPLQSEARMDMFRIYKSGSQVKRKGDEQI